MSNEMTKGESDELAAGDQTTKSYTNGDITVYWRPDKCIHSANCLVGLPAVFNTQKRPWIRMQDADSEQVMKTVDTCPSRALTYLRKSGIPAPERPKDPVASRARVQILKNGPAIISGDFLLQDASGKAIPLHTEVAAICRCGASRRRPFCDGSHVRSGFKD